MRVTRNSMMYQFKLLNAAFLICSLVIAFCVWRSHANNNILRQKVNELYAQNTQLAGFLKINLAVYSNAVYRIETSSTNLHHRIRAERKKAYDDILARLSNRKSMAPDTEEEKPKLKFHDYMELSGVAYVHLGRKRYRKGNYVLGYPIEDICPDGVLLGGIYYEVQNN